MIHNLWKDNYSHQSGAWDGRDSVSLTVFFQQMAGGKKLSKEDEILLQNFSRNVSTKFSALFYANSFIISAIPLCTFQ